MNSIFPKFLITGNTYKYQMSHWSPDNWKVVEIEYIGKAYITMKVISTNQEICVRYKGRDSSTKPVFKEVGAAYEI